MIRSAKTTTETEYSFGLCRYFPAQPFTARPCIRGSGITQCSLQKVHGQHVKHKLEIGLLWHSDRSGNLGVGALTIGNMALIERAAARAGITPHFHLFQMADREHSYLPEGRATRHFINGRYMVRPGGYWSDIRKLDLMLDIGAGDSFADIYPDKRFAYIIATKLLCLWRGVPLLLSPQTIGPFSRQPHKALAAHVMRRARAVFARDELSFDAIRAIAPKADAQLAIDVAFALPFEQAPRSTDTPRVGINLSGLLWAGGYGGKNDYGLTIDYIEFNARLIEELLARGVKVELFSHVTSGIARDDDPTAAQAMHSRFPQTVVIPPFDTPSEAKSYVSGLDFVVAGRMHASIAAWSSGVPVLPVSYSRKFEGLYGSLGYDWLIPARGYSTDQALARALEAFDNRDAIRTEIARLSPAVDDKLDNYVAFLASLFADLAP